MSDAKKPAPVLFARLPNNRSGQRTLAGLREGLNNAGYLLRVKLSGPRAPHAYDCKREDATGFRLYLDHKNNGATLDRYAALRDLGHARAEANELRDALARVARERDDYHAIIQDADVLRSNAVECRKVAEANLARIPRWIRWLFGAL